jgi:type II secretory pathway component GspD/PulD (secretin)
MSFATLTLLPTLILAATAHQPVVEAPLATSVVSTKQDMPLYPPAKSGMELNVDRADTPTTLIDVLTTYGEVTGQTFTYDQEVENILRHTELNLTRSRTIPQGEVQAWFESLMAQNEYILQPMLRGAEPLTSVLHQGSTHMARMTATPVTVEQLPSLKHNAATLVTTIVNLPNIEVRQISNSMRAMILNQNTQTMLPAGSTNSIHLTGPAPWVASVAASLLQINAQEGSSGEATVGVEMMRFQLKHAEASMAAELIQSLVASSVRISGEGSVVQQHQGPMPSPITVMADMRTNALLVTVRGDLVQRLRDTVALVDVEVAD